MKFFFQSTRYLKHPMIHLQYSICLNCSVHKSLIPYPSSNHQPHQLCLTIANLQSVQTHQSFASINSVLQTSPFINLSLPMVRSKCGSSSCLPWSSLCDFHKGIFVCFQCCIIHLFLAIARSVLQLCQVMFSWSKFISPGVLQHFPLSLANTLSVFVFFPNSACLLLLSKRSKLV